MLSAESAYTFASDITSFETDVVDTSNTGILNDDSKSEKFFYNCIGFAPFRMYSKFFDLLLITF